METLTQKVNSLQLQLSTRPAVAAVETPAQIPAVAPPALMGGMIGAYPGMMGPGMPYGPGGMMQPPYGYPPGPNPMFQQQQQQQQQAEQTVQTLRQMMMTRQQEWDEERATLLVRCTIAEQHVTELQKQMKKMRSLLPAR